MRWLIFGTYDVQHHPRVAVLIEGLRAAGDEVTELNETLRLDTAGRVAMMRQPWRLPLLAAKLVRCWTLLATRSRRARRARPDAVLVGYLGQFDIRLARWLFPGVPVVLDHLASASGIASDRGLARSGGLKSRLMRAIDDGALRRAEVVVVDTAEHADAVPPLAAERVVVAPVGAAQEWFEHGRARAATPDGRPLRAIFVGLFTPLHGTRVIGQALATLAGDDQIEVTMVGTGQDYLACRQAAAANQHVTWIDWVPGAELPGLVAAHDVSLGIFGTTTKALNVVPTKVFQGAAAGVALITSDTPPQRAALPDAALFVPPGDAEALAGALRRLAKDRDELATLQAAAYDRAASAFTPVRVVAPVRERTSAITEPLRRG